MKNIRELTAGQLFGTLFDNTLLIIGFNTSAQKNSEKEESNEKNDLENSISYDILPNLPSEVDLCGAFVTSSADKDVQKDAWLKEILDFDVTDNPVVSINCYVFFFFFFCYFLYFDVLIYKFYFSFSC